MTDAVDADAVGDGYGARYPAAVPWHRQTKAFAVRTLRELFRDRAALFWGLAAPVFFYLVFGVVMSPDGGGVERGANAVIFGVFGAFSVSLVIFATGLTNDLSEKRYRKLRSLPVAPSADVVGRFCGALALSVVSFGVVLAVGALTGAAYELESALSVPVVLVSLALFCAVAVAGAVAVAAVLDTGEYVVGVTNMLALALFFLTGYNGLVPQLAPDPLPSLVNVLPNSLAARVAVTHLTAIGPAQPGPLAPPALPTGPKYLALLAVEAVLMAAIAAWVMRRRIYGAEAGE